MAGTSNRSATLKLTIGPLNFSGLLTRTAAPVVVTVAAQANLAKTGTITARTDADTGVATLSASHGIVTNNIVDVYWATGHRRGMTATVSGNDVTVDGGSGDSLPIVSTAVRVCKVEGRAFAFNGDSLQQLCFSSPTRALVRIKNSSYDEIVFKELQANCVYYWYTETGEANPCSGESSIITFEFSQYNTSLETNQLVQAGAALSQ